MTKTVTFTSPVEYGDEIWVNDIIVENGKVTAVESHPTKVMCIEFFADRNSPFIYTHSGRYLAEDVFMDEEEAKMLATNDKVTVTSIYKAAKK